MRFLRGKGFMRFWRAAFVLGLVFKLWSEYILTSAKFTDLYCTCRVILSLIAKATAIVYL
jgi:CRISPR/Cas system-associated endonuclease Cas1